MDINVFCFILIDCLTMLNSIKVNRILHLYDVPGNSYVVAIRKFLVYKSIMWFNNMRSLDD